MNPLSRTDRAHPDWLPLLLLALFGVGFFFPVLFMGRAPAVNSLRNFEPWRSERIEEGDGTVEYRPGGEPVYTWNEPEAFADDLNRQFIPWGLYAQERIRSGEWPLWNPHLACGQPLYANHQTGLINPLILGCYLVFSGLNAFTAIFLLIFIFAGWGMYAYLRVLGLGRWPSAIAAASYQFMLGYIPTLDTLIVEKALFPVLLYSVERLVRAPCGKGSVWAVISIVLLALVQTTCHVQEAIFISYMLGPYIVFIAGGPDAFPRGRVWITIGRRFLLALGIFIPAILVGLIQNLPTLELYTLSARSVGFEEQITSATVLEQNLTWIQSLMIVFPRLFGDYLLRNMPLEHYLLNYGYVGIVTLLAAPLAGWIAHSRRQVWFWRIAALVFFLAIVWNWFYFNALALLPLFRISLQKPFSPLFFALIVLAGHGFQFLLEPRKPDTSANRILGYLSLLAYGATLSVGLLYLYAIIRPGQPFNSDHAYVFGQITIGAVIASLACFVTSLYWRKANMVPKAEPARLVRMHTVAALGILAIVLIDLWPVKAHFNPFVKHEDLYFETDSISLLDTKLEWEPGNPEGPYRFGRSWKKILPPNTGMLYDLDDFAGYDSNLVGRYTQLLETTESTLIEGVHFIEAPRSRSVFRKPLWNMLGVKYVLAHPGHLGQFAPVTKWRHLYIDEILIVVNRAALPRMHLVDAANVTPVRLRGDALARSVELNPAREAVIERDDPDSLQLPESESSESPGEVVITDYQPEMVAADVRCNTKSLLCFFDVWFPGWEVTIDGADAELERVNYTFKGVFVDEGDHEVVFRYRPTTLYYGIHGTAIGIILSILLAMPLSLLAGTTRKSD